MRRFLLLVLVSRCGHYYRLAAGPTLAPDGQVGLAAAGTAALRPIAGDVGEHVLGETVGLRAGAEVDADGTVLALLSAVVGIEVFPPDDGLVTSVEARGGLSVGGDVA